MPRKAKTDSRFYVDNVKFTEAVVEYAKKRIAAEKAGTEPPPISNYIGECFMRIAEGCAARPNFRFYSFTDAMISDALFDLVKGIQKFDPEAPTRSGKPNAHSYFSTSAYWAMVRRIQAHQKEAREKLEIIKNRGLEAFIADGDFESMQAAQHVIEELKISAAQHEQDKEKRKTKHYGFAPPAKKKKENLENFMDDND